MYFIRCIIISLLMMSITNCSVESSSEVDAELVYYFQLFEEEAVSRDISIDMSSILVSGYIENIETRGTLGQCKSYSDGSQTVVIDDNYWQRADDYEKEYIVFHELGHCVLGRDHNNVRDDEGICESIMQSGNNLCTSNYNDMTREQLLDELFSN
jgi:hypothetical protein